MNFIVCGASAGLGRAISERLAAEGNSLAILGSDIEDLGAVAADLSIRYDTMVHPVAVDLTQFSPEEARNKILAVLSPIDGIFLVAGFSSDGDVGVLDEPTLRRLVSVNFTGPAALTNALVEDLTPRPKSFIVGIGSVAVVRPRGKNVVYGAAKRALEHYLLSLHQSLRTASVKVQVYRVGYMDTNMMWGRSTLLPLADPDTVARDVVANLSSFEGLAYLPRFWRWLMLAYQVIPNPIFRRLTF